MNMSVWNGHLRVMKFGIAVCEISDQNDTTLGYLLLSCMNYV
jgi:hypothetical protein